METKKLTCCDLMIGDYMKYKDGTIVQIARVGDVSPMDAPIYCHTQLEGYFPCQFEDIEPISLTAKVLDMNFERKVYNDYAYYELDDNFCVRIVYGEMFLARWDDDELSVYQSPHAILRLNYVHELQHALRLCGVDKEITI